MLQYVLGAVLAGVLLGAPTPVAAAVPSADPVVPVAAAMPTALVLTISNGQQQLPVARAAVLTCDPPNGTHAKATEACATLAGVNGDISALETPAGVACILIYAPVTVTATGLWRGHWMSYKATFGNECALHAETGAVYQF